MQKGGVQSSLEILTALENGTSVAMTANVPKGPARRVGKGVITLAKLSGRPIFPVAVVTSSNIYLNSWDKTAINLPFSKVAFDLGNPVWVNDCADDIQLEKARIEVENQLMNITKRANELVGAARQNGMLD